jgi:hypothetical protein
MIKTYRVYRTVAGDTWDGIALKEMSSEMFKDVLMKANRKHRFIYTFPAGVVLTIPETAPGSSDNLPPWKK